MVVVIPNHLQGAGVLIRTLRKGDETSYPQRGDVCHVSYNAPWFLLVSPFRVVIVADLSCCREMVQIEFESFLEDGTPIPSPPDLPLEFQLGQGQVVPGWDAAVPYLSLGQVIELTVPSLYAYGVAGCPPHIPPHATLVYRMKLVRITPSDHRKKKLNV